MSGTKRRCGTCRFFEDAGIAGNGWCTHPKRQSSSDVRILVRQGELACRNSWGNDYWEDRNAPPAAAQQPASAAPTPAPVRVSVDDEVTSVVSQDAPPPRDEQRDVVVEQTTLPDESGIARRYLQRQDDPNEPAHQDQAERASIISRSERDAILLARERHRLRRGGVRGAGRANPRPQSGDSAASETAFAPDDFVEEEGPSASGTASAQATAHDVVLHEAVAAPGLRSRRLRRARAGNMEQRAHGVPAEELSPEARAAADQDGESLRFNTVPEIRPDIELPRREPASPAGTTEGTASPNDAPTSPYDEVLKRAQAIKAAARAEREARQRQARRPIIPPARSVEDPLAPSVEPVMTQDAAATADPDPDIAADPTHATTPDADSTTALMANRVIGEGIRFRRPTSTADADEDARDAVAAEELPEPVRERRWWRGLIPPRARRSPSSSHADPGPTGWEDVVEDDPAGAEEDVAAATLRSEDGPVASLMTGAEDHPAEPIVPGDDQAVDGAIGVPDEGTGTAEDRLIAGQSPAAPTVTFEPLNLHDARGLDAFRSRLFEHTWDDARAHVAVDEPSRAPAQHVLRTEPDEEAWRAEPPIDPDALLEDPRDAAYEPEVDPAFDIRTIIRRQSDLLNMTIQVAPEVPRKCATCRSYRASEQGERGWCTNTWAFTHRQMVNAEDLACRSTIGCWWLPADREVWLDDTEPGPVRPTPRVDRLIAHLQPLRRTAGR